MPAPGSGLLAREIARVHRQFDGRVGVAQTDAAGEARRRFETPDAGADPLHAELKRAYGSLRMVRELHARGFSTSKARVERLMRDNGMPFKPT